MQRTVLINRIDISRLRIEIFGVSKLGRTPVKINTFRRIQINQKFDRRILLMHNFYFFRDIYDTVGHIDGVSVYYWFVVIIPRERRMFAVIFDSGVDSREISRYVDERFYAELVANFECILHFLGSYRTRVLPHDENVVKPRFFILAVCIRCRRRRNPAVEYKRLGLHVFVIGKRYRSSFVFAVALCTTRRSKPAESQRQTHTKYFF